MPTVTYSKKHQASEYFFVVGVNTFEITWVHYIVVQSIAGFACSTQITLAGIQYEEASPNTPLLVGTGQPDQVNKGKLTALLFVWELDPSCK